MTHAKIHNWLLTTVNQNQPRNDEYEWTNGVKRLQFEWMSSCSGVRTDANIMFQLGLNMSNPLSLCLSGQDRTGQRAWLSCCRYNRNRRNKYVRTCPGFWVTSHTEPTKADYSHRRVEAKLNNPITQQWCRMGSYYTHIDRWNYKLCNFQLSDCGA